MQSRRDQVQAQSYVLGRLKRAMVGAEPDGLEDPHRRMVVGSIGGLLLALLIVAGFIIFGLFVPGAATTWRAPGNLVVEKETGTRYVFVDGSLRPVLNYTSARLLFEREPKVVSVSRNSLAGVPHGQPVGIVGAPDALPAAGKVGDQVWTVCAVASRDLAGTLATVTTLTIEDAPAQARRDRPLAPDEAIVVSVDKDTFLVWQGRRMRFAAPWLARVLGYDSRVAPVEAGWLESVPVGPDLAPVPVPQRGTAGPAVDGGRSRIGELFVAAGADGQERRYLLRADGLAELSPVAYAIVAADPETVKLYGGAVRPAPLSPAALGQLPVSRGSLLPGEVPQSPPRLAVPPDGGSWCVRHTMRDGAVEVTAAVPAPGSSTVGDSAGVTRSSRTAGRIAVGSGVGGLVLAGRLDQAPGSGFYLITDSGVKFPLASAAVAKQLGYPAEGARPVPRRLLEMLPTGPLIGPALAGG